MQETFGSCVQALARFHWQPGFNDPYALSWLMVAIYFLAAALAFMVAQRAPFPAETKRRERVFWGVLTGVLAFLAVNKQADLQTLLLASGRCLMWETGWMAGHQTAKRLLLTVVALVTLGGSAVFLWSLRRTMRRTALPLLGLVLMVGFIVFRAAEILNILGPTGPIPRGIWTDRVLEVVGPLTLIVAGASALKWYPGAKRAPASPGT